MPRDLSAWTTMCSTEIMVDFVGPESAPGIVQRLRFVSSSAPAIYLNEKLAEEMFVSQIGAISDFALTAARSLRGEGGLPVVKVGASTDSSTKVGYDVKDPLTRALLLHSAISGQATKSPKQPIARGSFVELVGRVSMPGVPGLQEPPPSAQTELQVLSRVRDQQEAILRALTDDATVLLTMLIQTSAGDAAAVIDRRWFRAGLASSYLPQGEHVVFGIAEQSVDQLPFITVIYLRPYL